MRQEASRAVAELVAKMRDTEAPVPMVIDVALAYAHQVDAIANKLTPEELASMVALGVVINRRCSRLVPVLGEAEIDAWIADTHGRRQRSLDGGRPV